MANLIYSPAWFIHPPYNNMCNTITTTASNANQLKPEHWIMIIVAVSIMGTLILLIVKYQVEREMREAEEKAEKEGYNIWK